MQVVVAKGNGANVLNRAPRATIVDGQTRCAAAALANFTLVTGVIFSPERQKDNGQDVTTHRLPKHHSGCFTTKSETSARWRSSQDGSDEQIFGAK
jgi:hypothetical protein